MGNILKRKKSREKTLITHNGKFHADDVFASATLRIFSKGRLKIVRTRDDRVIKEGDWVVDVGGVYESGKNKFDHHQPKGAGKRKNGIPYASFGLVWKKYGKIICGSSEVSDYLDKSLVQFIDAEDNGFRVFKSTKDFLPYTISDIISSFNPSWNERENPDQAFKKAVKLAEQIIEREIIRTKAKLKAKKFILSAYKRAKDKRIIILKHYYSWQEFIIPFLKPRFVIFPKDNSWQVVAVRKNLLEFSVRKPFPGKWAGMTDKKLALLSNVPDALFCHKNLFMAVAKSKEGAILLAKKALL